MQTIAAGGRVRHFWQDEVYPVNGPLCYTQRTGVDSITVVSMFEPHLNIWFPGEFDSAAKTLCKLVNKRMLGLTQVHAIVKLNRYDH